MAQEIELKLRCDKSAVPLLVKKLSSLGDTRQRALTLDNTYYDTPDLALHARAVALRVRRAGRRLLQTVKTAGTVSAGLSSRSEWETTFRGQFDFSCVEDDALQGFLTEQAASLAPVFCTRFKRTAWHLNFAGASIEAAIDVGEITVGAYHEPIHELELELKSGPRRALQSLHRELSTVATLSPTDDSKAQRGFALWHAAVIDMSSHTRKMVAHPRTQSTMDLLLWRHAEAEDGSPDSARALTVRGKKQAQQVASWLQKHQPKKLRVIASPAKRALQTVSAFTDTFDVDRRLSPGCSVADIIASTGWPEGNGAVLVVGHQPSLGQLAALLLGGVEANWSIKKGALWWFSNRVREGETQTVLRAVISPEMAQTAGL